MFRRLRAFLYGLSLGAGAMYLYDPEWGQRRRALLRDQVIGALNSADDAFAEGTHDLSNRFSGLIAEARTAISQEAIPDDTLVQRVRSKMGAGNLVSYPRTIEVTANHGYVTLRGPVLAAEAQPLLLRVAEMRGVRGVMDELEVHARAGEVPALQGEPRHSRTASTQGSWTPAARLLGTMAGGMLTITGLLHGGLMGRVRSVLGLGLLARSLTNRSLREFVIWHSEPAPNQAAGGQAFFADVSQASHRAARGRSRAHRPVATGEPADASRSKTRSAGQPGGGAGNIDHIEKTGVYPASDPDAPPDAEAQGMASWGQSERGASGYEDSGDSELTGLGEETDFGSVIPGRE